MKKDFFDDSKIKYPAYEPWISNYDKNIGSFVFQFTDGLWKAGNPSKQDTGGSAPNSDGTPYDGTANEEYWGIVDINRNKKIIIKNTMNVIIKISIVFITTNSLKSQSILFKI